MEGKGEKPVIRVARRLRRAQTSSEELLWRELRAGRLDGWKFRRQMPIASHVVDFACVSARLTIELDGQQHQDQPDQDAERTAKLAAAGYFEIRFSNEDVRGCPHWVIEEIRRALDVARSERMRAGVFRMD